MDIGWAQSALQSREVDATSVPLAMAIGMGRGIESMRRGPAMPRGISMMFSQQVLSTRE